jgi:hypothetical protein
MYDINKGTEIFEGSDLTYIEQLVTSYNNKTNEIIVIDRNVRTIKIFNYDKYKVGDTKHYIKEIKTKQYI